MKTCSHCNTVPSTEAKFCENCGHILSKLKQNTVTKKDLNFCSSCGKTGCAEPACMQSVVATELCLIPPLAVDFFCKLQ